MAEIVLGKMLQTAPSSTADVEVRYLRAGHLGAKLDEVALPFMWASPRDLELFSVRSGDLLVAEGGDVGRAEFAPRLSDATLIQNSLHRVRTNKGDIRFLRYALQSVRASGWLDVVCNKSTFSHLTREKLAMLRVPFPPRDRQRAIADFLDAETTRIDALIAKKRRMIELLDERAAIIVESAVRSIADETGERPLKRMVDFVTVGIVVKPSDWYAEEGVIALRGLNVQPGRLSVTDVVRISAHGHRIHKKSALRAGDVVVVRTGQAGTAAVVPPELHDANCIDLLLIRPGSLDAEYLTLVLNSDWTQKHIDQHSVGTIQSHFNVAALRELPIPSPSVARQWTLVRSISEARRPLDTMRDRLNRQIELLHEHREALITAAVTGELEVSGAAA